MKENSIEEDIEELKRLLYRNELSQYGKRKLIKYYELQEKDYKRVLKENERYKKSDYETICLENNELREITDRIQSEYNDLLKDNFKLKNELETKRKEYQETYKDVREELKELRKENEELKKSEQQIYDDYQDIGKIAFEYSDEIEQQNKIIDLMAEYIESKKVLVDKYCYVLTKETIKQYFKNKSKEVK